MRRILLSIAIASCIAAPTVLAQGRSGGAGGPPSSGPAASRPAGGPTMGGTSAGMGRGGSTGATASGGRMIDMQSPLEMRRAAAQQRRAEAEARRLAAQENAAEEAGFGQATAERARTLKDADLETRKAFGTGQAALAKAKAATNDDDDDVEVVDDDTDGAQASPGQSAFGRATAQRAKTLKDADTETRKSFGKDQSALAKARAEAARDDEEDE